MSPAAPPLLPVGLAFAVGVVAAARLVVGAAEGPAARVGVHRGYVGSVDAENALGVVGKGDALDEEDVVYEGVEGEHWADEGPRSRRRGRR